MNDSLLQDCYRREVDLVGCVRTLLQVCVAVVVGFGCLSCFAQTDAPKTEDAPATEVDPAKLLQPLPTLSANEQEPAMPGVSFGMTIPSDWEFGLQINSPAASRGIVATFPVPRVWPEQEVEVLEEFQTDNVARRLTFVFELKRR